MLNNLHVLTYATHNTGLFNDLINNPYNIKVNVLGYGKKWNGFLDKIKGVKEYCKINYNKNDIVVFVDGFDTKINKNLSDLKTIFDSFNCDILISNDRIHTNPVFAYAQKKVFASNKSKIAGNKYIIANSGLYMGYFDKIILLCEKILNVNTTDDQVALNRVISDPILSNGLNIKIDTDNIIFLNSDNSIKNSNSYFIQYPGGNIGNFNYRLDRYTRALFEYYEYFYFELTIIFVILFNILQIHDKYNVKKNKIGNIF